MPSIREYRSDISDYRHIKDKLQNIADSLSTASHHTDRLSRDIASAFRINNAPAKVVNRIDILGRSINDEVEYIRHTIMPSIDDAIHDAKRNIERLEEEKNDDHD